MALARISGKKTLLISNEFFIVTIVFYVCLVNLVFLYIYRVAYYTVISHFLSISLSLAKMNSLFPLVWRDFINVLFLFSTFGNQVQKVSINLFFEHEYITHVLQIFASSSIAIYVFFKTKGRLCGPYRLTYISSSFSFTSVISLLQFITQVYLLVIYKIYRLSKLLSIIWNTKTINSSGNSSVLLALALLLD